jgi:hypothetical protein
LHCARRGFQARRRDVWKSRRIVRVSGSFVHDGEQGDSRFLVGEETDRGLLRLVICRRSSQQCIPPCISLLIHAERRGSGGLKKHPLLIHSLANAPLSFAQSQTKTGGLDTYIVFDNRYRKRSSLVCPVDGCLRRCRPSGRPAIPVGLFLCSFFWEGGALFKSLGQKKDGEENQPPLPPTWPSQRWLLDQEGP